jgi:hypothetical protein
MKSIAILVIIFVCSSYVTVRGETGDGAHGVFLRAAVTKLRAEHIRQDSDARELSRAWARKFLLTLDPLRMHFLATDENEFMKQAHMLVVDAENGKVDAPLKITTRFLERLENNASLISKLLTDEHDFTIDENVRIEHSDYPSDKADSHERWRLRIKYEILMEKLNDSSVETSRDFLRGRYSRIETHFRSFTMQKILSLYVDALAKAIDPHAGYFDESTMAMFRTGLTPNYSLGIRFTYRNGDLWVEPTRHEMLFSATAVTGYRIVAIRIKGEKPIHLSGLTDWEAIRTIVSPVGELGDANEVILDLDNPRLGRRKVITCVRSFKGR